MGEGAETIEQLRASFAYGTRSNLSFKFVRDLTDAEFGDFLDELLHAVSKTTNDGDPTAVIDVAYRWQVNGYSGHLGDPSDFAHRYDDTPVATLSKPLSEARLALVTSSGHFLNGDDPMPFGVPDMTQAEAESRISDFLRVAPELSTIPVRSDPSSLRVRHGGYPVEAVASDNEVALPLAHLRDLERRGVVGRLLPSAYSFVGATSQVRLKKSIAPSWADRLQAEGADAVLLVPV